MTKCKEALKEVAVNKKRTVREEKMACDQGKEKTSGQVLGTTDPDTENSQI